MRADAYKFPPTPVEPHESECCGRNCENCVFVCYERALKRWREKIERIKRESGIKT